MQNPFLENTETRGRGMKSYIIDPRLEAVCLPLSKDEYDLLESQIKRDGCLDPVKVWDRDGELVLLDGHNRLKICKDKKLPIPESTTIEIGSIDEAVIWICDNQKGRRNVATEEERNYISGKRHEAQKNINRKRDEKGVFKSDAPRPEDMFVGQPSATARRQAAEEGCSHFKVEQNAKFAKGVDMIRETSPVLAEKILKPKSDEPKLTKSAVTFLPKLKAKDPEKFVEAVQKIEDAMTTKDDQLFKKVVHEYVKPGEPTRSEKLIAAKRNLKPEHVQYAHEHNIPIDRLRTIPQLERMNGEHKSCSNIWDGIYKCKCGAKFELFGAEICQQWCPLCGSKGDIQRM
jgi:hypothetical protein